MNEFIRKLFFAYSLYLLASLVLVIIIFGQEPNSTKTTGAILSILGICFNSPSIIGKQNLQKWDQDFLVSFKQVYEDIGDIAILNEEEPYLFLAFLVNVIIWFILSRIFPDTGITGIFAVLSIASLVLSFKGYSLIAGIILTVIYSILILPYVFIKRIDKSDVLERTISFFGVILGITGIVLMF